MKTTKRLASLLLALVMLFAITITASAANEEKGSITIDNAIVGQTYTVYKILDLESYDTAKNAYSYKAESAWEAFINGTAKESGYFNVDDQGYVSWVDGADVAAFAKLAKKYAADNNIANQGSEEAETATVAFTDLELGYYLVDSTLGTLCSLDTTNPDATIKEKNSQPTVNKKVEEDSTGVYGESNDADIAQTVNFQTTISAKKGAENYVLHDKMSDGLTLDKESITVKVGADTLIADTDYTVEETLEDTEEDIPCTFHIVFKQAYLDKIIADTDIVVSYSASLNKDAVIGEAGNPNETWLDYGDKTNTTSTEHSETVTYTWELNIYKYAVIESLKTPLKGAEFILFKTVDNVTSYAVVENGKFTRWVGDKTNATTLKSGEDGYIAINGLDSDNYFLEETKAPDGYNKLPEAKVISISEEGVVSPAVTSIEGLKDHTVAVENKAGTMMPETGSIGTTILYVLGTIMICGTAVALIAERRKNANITAK